MGYDWGGYSSYEAGYSPNQEPRHLRKGVYSKIVLALVILTVLIYTGVVLCINLQGLEVQSELTYCFYAFFGTEIISLVTIRVAKVKGGDRNAVYKNSESGPQENSESENDGPAGIPETNPANQQDGSGLGV